MENGLEIQCAMERRWQGGCDSMQYTMYDVFVYNIIVLCLARIVGADRISVSFISWYERFWLNRLIIYCHLIWPSPLRLHSVLRSVIIKLHQHSIRPEWFLVLAMCGMKVICRAICNLYKLEGKSRRAYVANIWFHQKTINLSDQRPRRWWSFKGRRCLWCQPQWLWFAQYILLFSTILDARNSWQLVKIAFPRKRSLITSYPLTLDNNNWRTIFRCCWR